jgi:N6-adenosine-specific RNA methylase IME4
MQFHEVANIFPMMDGEQFKDLCKDIAANGLIEPIWTWCEKIIDGRNRFRACEEVGILPQFREWDGTEDKLLPFVISLNLKRRHLNESQRAMIAANMANLGWGQRTDRVANLQLSPVTQTEAAKMFNVSPRLVADAKRVIETSEPETIAKIQEGKTTVSQIARRFNRQAKMDEISKGNRPLDSKAQKYSVIYADPPWRYDFSFSDSRAIEEHYPTMEIEDIMALPVHDITSDNAILFLWCPPAFTKKAIAVVEAWGFEYRTNMVWVKDRIGAGQWVRQRHELLLIGRKGEIPTPEGSNRPDSVLEAPRQEHSVKPCEMYEIIERMYPELSRVELFARNKREGWHVWGNQS